MGAVEEAKAEREACPVLAGCPKAVAKQGKRDARQLATDVREIDPAQVWGRMATWHRNEPERLFMALVVLAVLVPVEAEVPTWVTKLDGGLAELLPPAPRIPSQTRGAA
jgi:hypothetical protein